MFVIIVVVVLFSSVLNIDGQRVIPSNFDAAIRELRSASSNEQYRRRADFDQLIQITSNPAQWLSLPFNESIPCEREMMELIENALLEQLWALKILDSWGKPLPSGLLKGNILWTGNYDECMNPLYQSENKSFVKQPMNTQYCK